MPHGIPASGKQVAWWPRSIGTSLCVSIPRCSISYRL